jgi:hypothetical protein
MELAAGTRMAMSCCTPVIEHQGAQPPHGADDTRTRRRGGKNPCPAFREPGDVAAVTLPVIGLW